MSIQANETTVPHSTTYFFVIYDKHTKCFHGGGDGFFNARKNTQTAKQYKGLTIAESVANKLNKTGVHEFAIIQYVCQPIGIVGGESSE